MQHGMYGNVWQRAWYTVLVEEILAIIPIIFCDIAFKKKKGKATSVNTLTLIQISKESHALQP